MYIYIYIHTHTHTHTYIHTYTYTYAYIDTDTCICIDTHIYIYTYVHSHKYMVLYINLFIYIVFYTSPEWYYLHYLVAGFIPTAGSGFHLPVGGFPSALGCPALGLGFPWKAEPPGRLPGPSSPLSKPGAVPCAAMWCSLFAGTADAGGMLVAPSRSKLCFHPSPIDFQAR